MTNLVEQLLYLQKMNNLSTGIGSAQTGALVCELCKKTFQTRGGLWKHKSVHTAKFSYRCSCCNKGFNEKQVYDGHINKHEGVGFACMKCNKTFHSHKTLRSRQKKCVHFKDI